MRTRPRTRPVFVLLLAAVAWATPTRADDLPVILDVEFQPFSAQVRRVVEALDLLGEPVSPGVRKAIEDAIGSADPASALKAIQAAIDPSCLLGVEINAEGRVSVVAGPAPRVLVRDGWKVFLVKVHNVGGLTAPLRFRSPNAETPYRKSKNAAEPAPPDPPGSVLQRWLDLQSFDDRPLNRSLSGLGLEYRVIQLYSRDAGHREARIAVDAGQGTQDLGFRGEADILFKVDPSIPVTLRIQDVDGSPTTASMIIRDALGRVYPAQGRRLAPDFFFHPQIYRRDGETIALPPGRFEVEFTRGPEYLVKRRSIVVGETPQAETFRLDRWADLAKKGYYSGDHHIHAAGCAHYESPTEGVTPQDMMRHVLGEDLGVACVLAWGPCWYAQKKFFQGGTHPLSTPSNILRYDVEVSGFPSSHAGHLCLLRLKEDDYPGTDRIEQWPSWDLPVLRWAKSQGAVVGFAHSGWGLQIKDESIPSVEIPPFDGIGANEYLVDVAFGAVDFLSTVDTPAPWELSIWYHTLNCGFRTRISGETDFPCIYGDRVGLGRSYVKLPIGPIDYDAWAEGVKLGRSYVSDGKSHLVDFRVNDVSVGEAGSELKLEAPGKVRVSASVAARLDPESTPEADAIRKRPLSEKPYWDLERSRIPGSRTVPVEVLVNGRPVARQLIEADGAFREVSFEISIDRSSWVALRILPSSHSNPVFVVVGGKPIRASKTSAEWCLLGLNRCWTQKEPSIRPEEKDEARKAYDSAREIYRAIRLESFAD